MSKITPSLEDYLETILFLQQKNASVRVTDVAVSMSISKPSVNKAINNLKEQGYVLHEHYGLLSLTPKGAEAAQNVASRHIVINRFLRDLLGIDPEIAEEEACKIEHVIGSETLEKLAAYLNNILGESHAL